MIKNVCDIEPGTLIQFIDGVEAVVLDNNYPPEVRYSSGQETTIGNWKAMILSKNKDITRFKDVAP